MVSVGILPSGAECEFLDQSYIKISHLEILLQYRVFLRINSEQNISDERSISMASCSTSWCRAVGTQPQSGASSGGCSAGRNTSHGASSWTGSGAMALRNARSCPTSRTARAATSTTRLKTHIDPRGNGSGRCNGSSRQSKAKGFLSAHSLNHGHSRPRRHLMTAPDYRGLLAKAFRIWQQDACARSEPEPAQLLTRAPPMTVFQQTDNASSRSPS